MDGIITKRWIYKDQLNPIEYDKYGQVLSDTNPEFQPFGFVGGLYDCDGTSKSVLGSSDV